MNFHFSSIKMAWRSNATDELLEIYANDSTLHGEMLLVTEYIKRGMLEEAYARLVGIPQRISLDSVEESGYDQQKAMIELHMALMADTNYLDSISSESVEWLRGIAANTGYFAAMPANALLGVMDTIPYHGPVFFPTTQSNRFAPKQGGDAPKQGFLKVFPNPAGSYFTIEYLIPEENFSDACVEILSIDGRLIKSIPLKDTQNQIIVNSGAFAKGIYLCMLKKGLVTINTTRVVIEK